MSSDGVEGSNGDRDGVAEIRVTVSELSSSGNSASTRESNSSVNQVETTTSSSDSSSSSSSDTEASAHYYPPQPQRPTSPITTTTTTPVPITPRSINKPSILVSRSENLYANVPPRSSQQPLTPDSVSSTRSSTQRRVHWQPRSKLLETDMDEPLSPASAAASSALLSPLATAPAAISSTSNANLEPITHGDAVLITRSPNLAIEVGRLTSNPSPCELGDRVSERAMIHDGEIHCREPLTILPVKPMPLQGTLGETTDEDEMPKTPTLFSRAPNPEPGDSPRWRARSWSGDRMRYPGTKLRMLKVYAAGEF